MSVDLRTRTDSDQTRVDAALLFGESLPARLDDAQALFVQGASELGLSDLRIEVEGEP